MEFYIVTALAAYGRELPATWAPVSNHSDQILPALADTAGARIKGNGSPERHFDPSALDRQRQQLEPAVLTRDAVHSTEDSHLSQQPRAFDHNHVRSGSETDIKCGQKIRGEHIFFQDTHPNP